MGRIINPLRPVRAIDTDEDIGFMYTATPEEVAYVHGLDPARGDGETRSEFVWLRLSNGDLCLATFPQDEAYLKLEPTFRSYPARPRWNSKIVKED